MASMGIERIVHRILGRVEIAEQADKRRENATRLRAKHGVDARANIDRGWLRHVGSEESGCRTIPARVIAQRWTVRGASHFLANSGRPHG
jgi:hypothetical protein